MDNITTIWKYLKKQIKNDYGVAGLMGNIKAESNFQPTNLQNNFETKLPGVYAVGDSIDKAYYQLVIAANDGATAAIDIINKMNH